jgi:ATP synthase regulation protein NCA2
VVIGDNTCFSHVWSKNHSGLIKLWCRHSWLAGSDDLESWVSMALEALASAFQEHIVGPLLLVRDELFNTFRTRRSIVSPADWESDRDSLLRMLRDFQSDNVSQVLAVALTVLSLCAGTQVSFRDFPWKLLVKSWVPCKFWGLLGVCVERPLCVCVCVCVCVYVCVCVCVCVCV